MSGIFTTYYGKRYRSVFSSTSRRKANIIAHSLVFLLKDEMDVKEKQTVLLEHWDKKHVVFVKCPFDKLVNTPRPKGQGFQSFFRTEIVFPISGY
jgi:hypothetical protein